jgi:hypothetical protein
MVVIRADCQDQIKLIIRNMEFPVELWETRSTYHAEQVPTTGTGSHYVSYNRGRVFSTGWVLVGRWLTEAQKEELNSVMRLLVSFNVAIYDQGNHLGHHNCSLLEIEPLQNGIKYHYCIMAGSDNLEV